MLGGERIQRGLSTSKPHVKAARQSRTRQSRTPRNPGRILGVPPRSRSHRESRAGVSPAQPRRKARLSHHQGLASLGRAGETPALRWWHWQVAPEKTGRGRPKLMGRPRLARCFVLTDSVVHAAGSVTGWRSRLILLRRLADEAFGREEQARDGAGVLQGSARDLFGVNNARFDEVFVFAGGHIEAFVALALLDFLDHDRAFVAAVEGEPLRRIFDGALDDVHADALVVIVA